MKKRLQRGLLILSMLGLVASCSTTNDVASNRGIQKRKYTKGYFIDFNHNKGGKTQSEDNLAKNEDTNTDEITGVEENSLLRSIEQEVVYVEAVQTLPSAEIVVMSSENQAVAEHNKATIISENVIIEKVEIEELGETITPNKLTKSQRKSMKTTATISESSDDAILYYILAILIPFLAVGLVTDWDVTKVVICLLLSIFFWIPGIIYALIVVSKNV